MGGDGGVIASNRRYMRGAGTADHTADYNSAKQLQAAYNNPQEVMTTCALTRQKFNKDSVIVACRFGRLYLREAAIQELLERKAKHKKNKSDDDDDSSSPLAHVRKLSELYTVRFDITNTSSSSGLFTPICPVTAKTLTGSVPAILLVPGKTTTTPNVVSESSWKQLSESQWQEEYGPITQRIRLAPPPMVLEELKATYEQEVIERNAKKNKKKNKKKRKEEDARDDDNDNDNGGSDGSGGDGGGSEKKKKKVQQTINKPAAATATATATSSTTKSTTQNRVESAIESNKVLSSLFTKKKSISEKEHKDNLFARS